LKSVEVFGRPCTPQLRSPRAVLLTRFAPHACTTATSPCRCRRHRCCCTAIRVAASLGGTGNPEPNHDHDDSPRAQAQRRRMPLTRRKRVLRSFLGVPVNSALNILTVVWAAQRGQGRSWLLVPHCRGGTTHSNVSAVAVTDTNPEAGA
jgi:hypothetical protein